jgi:hypothetical protein
VCSSGGKGQVLLIAHYHRNNKQCGPANETSGRSSGWILGTWFRPSVLLHSSLEVDFHISAKPKRGYRQVT